MSHLKGLLEDEFRAELMLQQQHLKTLSRTLRDQLTETGKKQKETLVKLEKKIQQSTLLSPGEQQESSHRKQLTCQTKHVEKRKPISSPLTYNKDISHQHIQTERLNSSLSLSPKKPKKPKRRSLQTSTQTPTGTRHREQVASLKTTQVSKEEDSVAECQKKFCSLPVPGHINQTLYKEIVEVRERERKHVQQQRKTFLLSMQKPFSFLEREKEKRKTLVATVNPVSQEQEKKAPVIRKHPPKMEKATKHLELEEAHNKYNDSWTSSDEEEKPATRSGPRLRTADRTRKERLGFLDEQPSFQPKINLQVPDFRRLHKNLQTEALRKSPSKEATKCQPFLLRTSALPQRKSQTSQEKTKEPKKHHLSRSRSLGALTSLSVDTLPTYITDSARRRSSAIRKAVEMRDSRDQESADWFNQYQERSQALRKSVGVHAKSLDPNSSLKKEFKEKLRQHLLADQRRVKEYMKDLREMKTRVSERPFLFEQLKQKNAVTLAEETYRNTLKKAGISEQFVEAKGAAVEAASVSSGSEDDTEENDLTSENYTCSREENVDDGEKIEDVEEESVKSKGEEMP